MYRSNRRERNKTRLVPALKSLSLIGSLLLGALIFSPASATVDVVYVGTWDSTGSGNPTGSGGPGMSAGQKYVVKISYDETSTVTPNVDVLDAFFNPSGNVMSTILMSGGSNTLDIFVPMEGLDTAPGTPFIYTQNQGDHDTSFIPAPTLNFVNNSPINNPANIIGLEFEGNFFAGAGNNVIELFNTSPTSSDPLDINMVSQILNLGTFSNAVTDTNGLATAVDLVVDAGPDIVYSAASLTKTTSSSVIQSNDLGAARSDGEDFVDATWSQTGTQSGNDITVAIADSGLATTVSTATWTMNASEQMTGKADSDTLTASYANGIPTINATATATAAGTDFTLSFDDLDLAVNALIAGFEMLNVTAEVDGATDATAFFADLINNGVDSLTNLVLETAFGAGPHSVVFKVTDKAGAMATSTVGFDVTGQPPSVPEPGTLVLLASGLLIMARKTRLHRRTSAKVS